MHQPLAKWFDVAEVAANVLGVAAAACALVLGSAPPAVDVAEAAEAGAVLQWAVPARAAAFQSAVSAAVFQSAGRAWVAAAFRSAVPAWVAAAWAGQSAVEAPVVPAAAELAMAAWSRSPVVS